MCRPRDFLVPNFLKPKTGVSLVELVVAVALLNIVSLAAVQLLNMTENTMIGSQTKLSQQLRSEPISSYIYKDFARGELNDAVVSRTYTNSNMPEDLRGGSGVTLVSLFGNSNRFDGENPVKFAHQITLDMGRFREFCQCSGPSGG